MQFSCNITFAIFVQIFMKFSPKCRTKKFGITFTILGSFYSFFNEKGSIIGPKSGLGIYQMNVFVSVK